LVLRVPIARQRAVLTMGLGRNRPTASAANRQRGLCEPSVSSGGSVAITSPASSADHPSTRRWKKRLPIRGCSPNTYSSPTMRYDHARPACALFAVSSVSSIQGQSNGRIGHPGGLAIGHVASSILGQLTSTPTHRGLSAGCQPLEPVRLAAQPEAESVLEPSPTQWYAPSLGSLYRRRVRGSGQWTATARFGPHEPLLTLPLCTAASASKHEARGPLSVTRFIESRSVIVCSLQIRQGPLQDLEFLERPTTTQRHTGDSLIRNVTWDAQFLR
jgi:hypothetical protein